MVRKFEIEFISILVASESEWIFSRQSTGTLEASVKFYSIARQLLFLNEFAGFISTINTIFSTHHLVSFFAAAHHHPHKLNSAAQFSFFTSKFIFIAEQEN